MNRGNEFLEGCRSNSEQVNEKTGNCFNKNKGYIEDDEVQQGENELNNLGLMYIE